MKGSFVQQPREDGFVECMKKIKEDLEKDP
jgi:hypothetical protein